MDAADFKQAACAAVDRLRDELLRISHAIHAKPELAFEEREAAALLVEALREAGLEVEAGAYGLETAFAAEFGPPGDACVALLAEYDALPEIGHACGHNVIAAAGVGAGLALATLGSHLPGRIRVLGTPAEERGGGKEWMARRGAFDGVDAALMIHPAGSNLVTMPSLCVAEAEVVYRGRAAHAAAAPERGINALDALVFAYQAIAALRQHLRATERIHGIFTEAGRAPNVVPERAAGRFYVRAADPPALAALRQRVAACFEAGARVTGAALDLRWGEIEYLAIRRNDPLNDAFRANAEKLGREFFPLEELPPSLAASTDMGNVSHRVPSIHPMLAAAPLGCAIHDPEFARWAASELGDAAVLDGAKALAMTALDFLCDVQLREHARAHFEAGG
ncbi:MAG TPA: M20 family metallopeptidase [Myxococcota bacterium]